MTSPHDLRILLTWSQGFAHMIPWFCSHDPRVLFTWSQGFAHMIPGFCSHDPRVLITWPQGFDHMTPGFCSHDPRVLITWPQGFETSLQWQVQWWLRPSLELSWWASLSCSLECPQQWWQSHETMGRRTSAGHETSDMEDVKQVTWGDILGWGWAPLVLHRMLIWEKQSW